MTGNRDLTSNKGSVPVSRGAHPIRSLQNDINQVFNDFFSDLSFPSWDRLTEKVFAPTPAIDITETDTGYSVSAELPGLQAKDVQIIAGDGYLTLKGEKTHEAKTEGKDFVRRERSYGSFQRVIGLPRDADLDNAKAEMQNGLLTLTINRKGEAAGTSRKINIREVA